MKATLLVVIFLFTTGPGCWGQDPTSNKTSMAALLGKLRSPEQSERLEAFEQIRSDPANLQRPEVRRALLRLLDRESHELDAQLLEAQKGYPDEGDNEPFAEYFSELLGAVDSFADWNTTLDKSAFWSMQTPATNRISQQKSPIMPGSHCHVYLLKRSARERDKHASRFVCPCAGARSLAKSTEHSQIPK